MPKMKFAQKQAICFVYVIAMFMVSFDGTIVYVALPAISGDLGVSASETGAVTAGYLLSVAVCLPIAGYLGDRFGTKRIFILALSVFTVASALCGFATERWMLNLFRVMQGIGGGLLTPVGMAMLFRTFTAEERVKVSRMLVLPIAIAPALGPILGGGIIEKLAWQWIFFINIPFGILAVIIAFLFIVEHKEDDPGSMDWSGFLLSASGFGLTMYALAEIPADGPTAAIWIMLFVGVGLLALFITVSLRKKKPMLDLYLLSDKLFMKMSIISFFAVAGLQGMLFLFPIMYQGVNGASALESGLTVFPEALGLMAASKIMQKSLNALGVDKVILFGLIGACCMFLLLSVAGPAANPWLLRCLLFGVGLFLGHTVIAVQFMSFKNIPSSSMGRATTLFNVQNRLGAVIGISVIASLLAMFQDKGSWGGAEAAWPYQFTLFAAALLLFGAILFSVRLQYSEQPVGKSIAEARDA
ncbi:MAG: DHA2 family efflux MFS transporter permease subunit [Bacillus sp. (in: firmicutes)]